MKKKQKKETGLISYPNISGINKEFKIITTILKKIEKRQKNLPEN